MTKFSVDSVSGDLLLVLSRQPQNKWFTVNDLIREFDFTYKLPARLSDLGAWIEKRVSDKRDRSGKRLLTEYRFSPDYQIQIEMGKDDKAYVFAVFNS